MADVDPESIDWSDESITRTLRFRQRPGADNALGRMPAGQLGVTTYIVPPLAIIMGLIFFGEVPALLAIGGGVLSLAGVALSRRKGRVPVAPENLPE